MDKNQSMSKYVLSIAKTARETEIILKEINLSKLIKNVCDIVKINYKNKDFKIISSTMINSMADKDRLEQVFVNIVENACKYSSKDSDIEIRIENKCDFNVVSIKNFGSYIEEKEIEHIFEKFYRIDNYLTSTAQGSGLGLYIAKMLIEKMNGNIKVNSSKEEDFTEFLVYIPVMEPERMTQKVKIQANKPREVTDV